MFTGVLILGSNWERGIEIKYSYMCGNHLLKWSSLDNIGDSYIQDSPKYHTRLNVLNVLGSCFPFSNHSGNKLAMYPLSHCMSEKSKMQLWVEISICLSPTIYVSYNNQYWHWDLRETSQKIAKENFPWRGKVFCFVCLFF